MTIRVWRVILFGVAAQALFCSEEVCPMSWVTSTQRGNGTCEVTCMNAVCEFDVSDCSGACARTGCTAIKFGDGDCNEGKC
jgi:hypothetical protein